MSQPVNCPVIAPRDAPYPKISYATFVLDGKVIGVRRAQRNLGPHSSQVIDTIPAVDKVTVQRLKSIRVLSPDSARLFEPCPGIPVIVFDTKRRWWWPW